MIRISAAKTTLWAVLAVHRYATVPGIWPGDLLVSTGEWSARMIIVAPMLTPLGQLFPANRALRWLIRHRRAFGVAAFGYALLHLAFYIFDMESVGDAGLNRRAGDLDRVAGHAVPGAARAGQQRCGDAVAPTP